MDQTLDNSTRACLPESVVIRMPGPQSKTTLDRISGYRWKSPTSSDWKAGTFPSTPRLRTKINYQLINLLIFIVLFQYNRRLVIPWLVHNALLCGLVFLTVVGGAITCFIVTATHIRGDLTTATYGYIILIPGAFAVGKLSTPSPLWTRFVY